MGRRILLASGAERLAAALDSLPGLDVKALDQRWRDVFGTSAPAGLSLALKVRVIAYRLQALALGDLDQKTAEALNRLYSGANGQGGSDDRIAMPIPDQKAQMPGTTLSREWAGQMHTVMVLADGYAWNGSVYASLSKVAVAITGTKWNGPRFFGLRERARVHREPKKPAA